MVEMFHSSRVELDVLQGLERIYCASTVRGAMMRQVEKFRLEAFTFRLYTFGASSSATFGEYVGDYDGGLIDRTVMEMDDADAVPFCSVAQDVGTTNFCVRPSALVLTGVELWRISVIGDVPTRLAPLSDFKFVRIA